MSRYDCVIIGAGPAGLMAASEVAAAGFSAAVIDKNNITGRKLRITGKGRCNITNACDFSELMSNITVNPKFLYSSFSNFSNIDIIDFFEKIGVKTVVERGKRVFPASQRAGDVADALEKYAISQGALIMLGTKANEIIFDNGEICGVRSSRGVLESKCVIIASGGLSYPLTGSTGDGYTFAAAAGHSVIKPRASLAALISDDSFMKELSGLSLKNAAVSLYIGDTAEGKPVYSDFGELLFTGSGVSGPVVLSASAYYKPEKSAVLLIDMKPALSNEHLYARIGRDFALYDRKIYANSLDMLLPRKMIPVFVKRSGIPPYKQVNQISREERMNIVRLLKNFTVNICDIDDIKNAVVTSGGVCVREVNPRTMESLLCSGLFFAGEVLDVDGYTGGFNLTIAFSTGYTAGRGAVRKLSADSRTVTGVGGVN